MVKRSKNFVDAIVGFSILSIIVLGVSFYFVSKSALIGPMFLGLGFLNLLFLKFYGVRIKTVYPDIIFGFIDNSVLVIMAVLGGQIAGVAGAIIGGAAGNTITDGVGGIFEGQSAEKLRKANVKVRRTAISSSLGKMAGCLFGAGVGLIFVWSISLIWAGISF